MTPEQMRGFVALIREHFRLRAENSTLRAILEMAARLNNPPNNWADLLAQARRTDRYRLIAEEHEIQLARIERTLDANELNQLIEAIPHGNFVN